MSSGGNNRHRGGYIFEKQATLELLGPEAGFGALVASWREAVHDVARVVLQCAAVQLGLPAATFEEGGLWGDVCAHGQLHVKRYTQDTEGEGLLIRLAAHRDPSVITLLIHDGEEALGVQGLQLEVNSAWCDIGGSSGAGMATLLVGELLEQATRGMFPALKHRVAQWPGQVQAQPRTAATLFYQPSGDQLLFPLPVIPQKKKLKDTDLETFAKWKERRYGKYLKQR